VLGVKGSYFLNSGSGLDVVLTSDSRRRNQCDHTFTLTCQSDLGRPKRPTLCLGIRKISDKRCGTLGAKLSSAYPSVDAVPTRAESIR